VLTVRGIIVGFRKYSPTFPITSQILDPIFPP
jgi:hypothetical protein